MKHSVVLVVLVIICSGCFYTKHVDFSGRGKGLGKEYVGEKDGQQFKFSLDRKYFHLGLPPFMVDLEKKKFRLQLDTRNRNKANYDGLTINDLEIYDNDLLIYKAAPEEVKFSEDSFYKGIYATDYFLKIKKLKRSNLSASIDFDLSDSIQGRKNYKLEIPLDKKNEHGLGIFFVGIVVPFSKEQQ